MSQKKKKLSKTEQEERHIGLALFVTYATPAFFAVLAGEYSIAAVLGALALSVVIASCGPCSSESQCRERSWIDPPNK